MGPFSASRDVERDPGGSEPASADVPVSADRAVELLLQARDIYRALGFESAAEALSALLAKVGEHGQMPAPAARSQQAPEVVSRANVFRREGEYWFIVYEGDAFRLRDTKGLRYLARLLASPGREIHALDLVAEEAGPADRATVRRAERSTLRVSAPSGSAEVLDAAARAAYRRRLAELQDDLEEAEGFHDPERAARARQEMEALAAALAGAIGLGGRSRPMGSSAERARQATTKALKAALGRISSYSPALGRHLASTVRTGTYCRYEPDPRLPIGWKL